jgi:N-acyl-D-amino-acid deacylase
MPSPTFRRLLSLACVLTASVAALYGLQQSSPRRPALPLDLVILNGQVLDGSGAPPRRADVAVRDGRIEGVGDLDDVRARRVIDAAGKYVVPGFIDTHTHAAEGLERQGLEQGLPLLAQGITTILANPDGSGPVDLAEQRRVLETRGVGVNVGFLIGHGSVRGAVLGMADRAPTDEELQRMADLVRRAMHEGAFGLSSGLFYAPGSYARTDEVVRLMEVVAESGGVHQSHIRDEGDYSTGLLASVDEIIEVAERTRTGGVVSHMKALGQGSWGLSAKAIEHIEQARARGVRMFADQYPYDASSTSLTGAVVPRWAQAGGTSEMRRRFADPALRDRLLAEIRANIARRGGAGTLRIALYPGERAYEGLTLAEVASKRGASPEQAALDLLSVAGVSIVSFNMSDDDIDLIMRQPWMMTASDGGLSFPTEGRPHPRSYGAFTRKLERYVRERKLISLETAIRSMTGLPAEVYGIEGRGQLREGAFADIVVFDLAAVHEASTYADPHQVSQGLAFVLVNGVPVVDGGRFTSALAGRVIRKGHR